MKIIIFGAGVQGTVFGVRLARAGHQITLIATHHRVVELQRSGATIRDVETSRTISADVTVCEELPSSCKADLCLVTVRREQLDDALTTLSRATQIERFLLLVNHANGSEDIFAALGRSRTVLAFPGVAGGYQDGIVCYVDLAQQHTVVEEIAPGIADVLRSAGFRVNRVAEMDAWLKCHAVFIVSMAGSLYEKDCNATRLATDHGAVRRFILAVREGWRDLDRIGVGSGSGALKFILCQAPIWLSVWYWSRLLSSERGELYFAAHVRHAPAELNALASDVRKFTHSGESQELLRLLNSIQRWHER